MATIDLADLPGDGVGHVSQFGPGAKFGYLIEKTISLADAVTAKGSALAQGDVIEVLDLPDNTLVLAGGVEVVSVMTGTSTDATIDVGFTGGDVDLFVDGLDLDAATAGAFATSGVNEPTVLTAADTVDILIATQTGTITGGTIRVFAFCVDLNRKKAPGLAALQS